MHWKSLRRPKIVLAVDWKRTATVRRFADTCRGVKNDKLSSRVYWRTHSTKSSVAPGNASDRIRNRGRYFPTVTVIQSIKLMPSMLYTWDGKRTLLPNFSSWTFPHNDSLVVVTSVLQNRDTKELRWRLWSDTHLHLFLLRDNHVSNCVDITLLVGCITIYGGQTSLLCLIFEQEDWV